MGFDLASTTVTIGATTKPLDNAMGKVKGQLKDLSETKVSLAIGAAMGAGMRVFDLALEGIKSLITSIPRASEAAADFEMTMARVQYVFGQMTPLVNKTIGSLAATFHYAKGELAGLANDMGTTFIGMGFGTNAAANLSSEILKLAVQAAPAAEMSLQEFMGALEAGMRGATRPFKRIGIFLTETRVAFEKQRLAMMGIYGVTPELTESMARLSVMMGDLRGKTGLAELAQKGLKGQMRQLTVQADEMWIAFGQAFKPLWISALKVANQVLASLGKLLDDNKGRLMDWAKNIGAKLEGLGFYWDNAGLYVQMFLVRLGGAFNQTKVYVANFKEIFAAFSDWMNDNWVLMVINALSKLGTALKNTMSNIVAFATWWPATWKTMFSSMSDLNVRFFRLMADQMTNFVTKLVTWMSGGGKGAFTIDFKGMGADVAKGMGLNLVPPEMKPLLEGAPKLNVPEFKLPPAIAQQLQDIGKLTEKQISILERTLAQHRAAWNKAHGGGAGGNVGQMAGPMMMPMGGQIAGGFVAISDWGKKIQEGALGQDAYQMAIANNTRKTNELLMMFGPRFAQEMRLMGMAGP